MRGFQRRFVRMGVIALILLASVTSRAADLVIGQYTLVGSTRISRTVYENTYSARVTNSGSAVSDVRATLTGHGANITVVDGELDFGDVGAGATVTSRDTFRVRHDRVTPFDPATLVWTIQSQAAAVIVPNVVGVAQSAAESTITNAQLTVGVIATASSPTVPAGSVIAQDPAAGTSVPVGSAVNLTVSSGPALVSVPNVVGQTQAAAEAALVGANLTVGSVSTLASATVPDGNVISQTPGAGSSVPEGTAVALTVSSGPALATVPNVVGQTQSGAESALTAVLLIVGTVTTANSDTIPLGSVISQDPAEGASVPEGSSVNLVLSSGPSAAGLPPDPSTVAPPVEIGVATNIVNSTAFLYSGPNPIQTGVAPGTIEPIRAAVLRGRVQTRDGAPLPGVRITILNHPEFGQTLSRADGMFDMAVNGGGWLTVRYEKEGFLPAQRQEDVPWQEFSWMPDVILIPYDTRSTPIDFSSTCDPTQTLCTPQPIQVAQSTPVTDADGTRQVTMLFSPGTTAIVPLPDGGATFLNSFHVRATEYTVGPNGPASMPAALPPTSAYTFAAEFSVDEAVALGADHVFFTQPVPVYVENFLSFPVGQVMPLGMYDWAQAVWIPSANGRIIKILGLNGDLAEVDSNGDGNADNGVALGMSDSERHQLAIQYQPGQSLWRVSLSHFSTVDENVPAGAPCGPPTTVPCGSLQPGQGQPTTPPQIDGPCPQDGSIILCETQALGEVIAIAGTPFRLHYQSDRVWGRATNRMLDVPLSGPAVPTSLQAIELTLEVAGREFVETFPPSPMQTFGFSWDGLDAYGRRMNGKQAVSGVLRYVYDSTYQEPAPSSNTFGLPGGAFSGPPGRQQVSVPQNVKSTIGGWSVNPHDLGGWTLDIQHAFDPGGKILYLGNGGQRSGDTLSAIITTVAGTGDQTYSGDGVPATETGLWSAESAFGPDGTQYIADSQNHAVRRIGPDGVITTVAGTGERGFSGDSDPFSGEVGPAADATLDTPFGVAVGPDGSLYIADSGNNRIRLVTPDGMISTIAGTGATGFGNGGFNGDGRPAQSATLNDPEGLAVAPDGSIYIADSGNNRVRVLRRTEFGPDIYIIDTIAGGAGAGPNGAGFSGDGGPATQAALDYPVGIALGPDGSLYIADMDNHRIRRVGPDGIITTVAGNGGTFFGLPWGGFSGDGGLATDALLSFPLDVAVGPDSSLYIADTLNHRIRLVTSDGLITTLAGSGRVGPDCETGECLWRAGFSGDGGPATAAGLSGVSDVAIAPDTSIYIHDFANNRIRRVSATLPGFSATDIALASDDGTQLYQFNASGRHLRTLNALTGAVVYEFGYDSRGLLSQVEDGDGNVTTIERGANGAPTAIVGPFGQRTALTVDANGYMASLSNPAGETFQMTYSSGGLLATFADPRGNTSRFSYDTVGRLLRDEDAAGGVTTLARAEQGPPGDVTVTATNPSGNSTTYKAESILYPIPESEILPPEAIDPSNPPASVREGRRRTVTFPDGTQRVVDIPENGATSVLDPDGTTTTTVTGPDPRFGMQAGVITASTTRTPGGLTSTMTRNVTAQLSDPTNPLSLVTRTETTALNGQTLTTHYEAATRRLTATTPVGRQVVTTTDAQGRVVSSQSANLAPTAYSYDARGRLQQLTQGTGGDARTTTFRYDSRGNLQASTDPLGRSTEFEYDDADRPTTQTTPNGTTISYAYDAAGNLTSLTTPEGHTHTFSYNSLSLQQTYTTPSNRQTQWSYNAERQLTAIARPDGRTVTYGFDGASRPASLTLSRGQIQYGYDSSSRLSSITAPGGQTLAYTYDGSLLLNETWAGGINGTVGRQYDNNFRVTERRVNNANPVAFSYDADGLLTQAGNLTITRNAQTGLISSTSLGNVTNSWSYNAFGEAETYAALYNGSTLFSTAYQRDSLGRITQKTETIGGVIDVLTYGYDEVGRLTTVTRNGSVAASYSYDDNGNRLILTTPGGSVAGTYDAEDRLTQYGAATYTYAENGDLLTKTVGTDVTGYQYDEVGNLLQVTMPNGDVVEYVIDGKNRRIGKKVSGVAVQGFLYQTQLNPIAELDGANSVMTRFVYAGRNVPDYMIKGGNTYRIVYDHLSSPRLVVDVATGTVAQQLDYDEFGVVTLDSNPGFQPFGFGGGLYDRDTGLVRFGARDYDPVAGRWTSKDPIGGSGGDDNLYLYVLNDPIDYLDPEGMKAEKSKGGSDAFNDWWKSFKDACKNFFFGAGCALVDPTGACSVLTSADSPDAAKDQFSGWVNAPIYNKEPSPPTQEVLCDIDPDLCKKKRPHPKK